MKPFDRKRILSNISTLTKEKNIRVGDLEAACGVSAGYFSRLNKGESNALPSIEVLTIISNMLEVSIDGLVRIDYEALTPSERYLIDFLDKLITKTSALELIWEAESIKKMNMAGIGFDEDAVQTSLLSNGDLNSYDEEQERFYFLFHEREDVEFAGPAYHVKTAEKFTLWLTYVSVGPCDRPKNKEIELYMQTTRFIKPICHTNLEESNAFKDALLTLYNAAAESSRKPKIDSEVKNLIDSFMSELPF